ncbi:hypothetical protein [Metabacillus arenae]|uniref:Uncharacterized protein n=1 Tax=Metabacillus arenae TaxID=2771434 RepID=A0A926NEN9_9BACI|nr:hypothetical protein [Metabacillus arenae]MBD1379078.1 hypothetical protein [Metabacillus arenae]
MGFKLPEKYRQKQQEIYDLKYVIFGEKEIHISELEDKTVTPEMQSQMRMNSYAQEDLPPKLTDEALLKMTKRFLGQCSQPRFPCTTYNEALIHTIVPELVKRLEENFK